jgi:DNA-binding GntR family transcriptional regulator
MSDDDGRSGKPGRRIGQSRERAIRQAHDVLRASIRRGLLGRDNPLVEFALIRSLGIGRNSVRQALQSLADEGLVVRRPGVGTLIARQMLRISADEILAFDASEEDPAGRVDVQVLAVEPVEIGEVLSRTLGLTSGAMKLVEVLVRVDGEPICVLASYVPRSVDENRFTQSYQSVSVAFEKLFGMALGETTTTIEAINADAWAAEVLGVAPGTALILREQVLIGVDGNAAILNFARYRADRVAFIASTSPAPHPDNPERP